jgi:competence protein ComEC
MLVFYMNLTGNTPSIVRATIMASVLLLAQVFERKTSFYNIVSFSAFTILIIDPRQLFDAGFILSYSAILSIMILYPKIIEWLNKIKLYANLNTERFAGKSIRIITGLLFGTLAAQIGTLPITALMFKKISMVSLIANLFAIPLSNISLALGFMVIIASLFQRGLPGVCIYKRCLMFSRLKAISSSNQVILS